MVPTTLMNEVTGKAVTAMNSVTKWFVTAVYILKGKLNAVMKRCRDE